MMRRAALMITTLGLAFLAVAAGRGASQTNAGGGAAPDSSKPVVDSTAVDRFAPTSSSYVKGSDVDISLGSIMSTTIDPGKGWTLTNSVMIERKRYRAREMEDINENLGGQATKIEPGLYAIDLSIGESYSRKKTLGLGRFGKEIVYNNERAGFGFAFSRPVLGATKSVLGISADGQQGLNDFKYVRSLSGGMGGSLDYTFGENLTMSGGFGTGRQRQTSDIGLIKFGAMPSSDDTLRAGFGYGRGDTKVIEVSYVRSDGIERTVMPPLGNSLEILDDPSKATKEITTHKGEELSVKSAVKPASFLSVDFQFQHRLANQDYAVQKQLSSGSENTDISANTSYQYSKSGRVNVKISRSESVNDYGPKSPSSFKERSNLLSMSLSHRISDSLSVNLSGTGYLKQRFFSDRESNPRDADYLYYHGEANLRGTPVPRISTDVTMAADRYETINIDFSLSGDNRVDYQYRVGPMITLKPATWVSISQDYTVKIEYTDFVYTEDKNYLNRTTTLNSKANFRIFRPLTFNMRHSYLMKDTGSYLMREGGRRYNRSNGNREQSLFLDMRYEVKRDFSIRAQADFRNQRGDVVGLKNGRKAVVSSTLFESGGMKVGVLRNKKIGSGGAINLDISYVRRYGPYITEERKEYWDFNSSVNLRF